MSPAVFLDKTETKLVGDKKSAIYKTVMVLIKTLRDKTGLKVSVIGTDKDGRLFELTVD